MENDKGHAHAHAKRERQTQRGKGRDTRVMKGSVTTIFEVRLVAGHFYSPFNSFQMYYSKRSTIRTFCDYVANATDEAWENLKSKLGGLVSNKRQGSFFKLFLTGSFGGSFHEVVSQYSSTEY